MERRDLDYRDVQRLLRGKHDLEWDPHAVVHAPLRSLCFRAGSHDMLPDIVG